MALCICGERMRYADAYERSAHAISEECPCAMRQAEAEGSGYLDLGLIRVPVIQHCRERHRMSETE